MLIIATVILSSIQEKSFSIIIAKVIKNYSIIVLDQRLRRKTLSGDIYETST